MATNKIKINSVSNGSDFGYASTTVKTYSPLPTNWTALSNIVATKYCLLQLGTGTANTTIYRCTDLVNMTTWSPITVPSGNWMYGDFNPTSGRIVLVSVIGTNSSTIYSDNDGVSWNVGTSFTGVQATGITFGNKFVIHSTSTTGRYSADGIIWGTATLPSNTTLMVYSSTMAKWFALDSTANLYSSTIGESTYTSITTSITGGGTKYLDTVVATSSGKILTQVRDDVLGTKTMKISSDGITFTTINTFSGTAGAYLYHCAIANIDSTTTLIYDYDNNKLAILRADTITFSSVGTSTLGLKFPQNWRTCNLNLAHYKYRMLIIDGVNVNKLTYNLDTIGGSTGAKYVTVVATNGAITLTKTLPISIVNAGTNSYTMQLSPRELYLDATTNGVVYPAAYTNANCTVNIFKNGILQSDWTLSAVNAAGTTTQSFSGNVLNISNMTDAPTTADIVIKASPPSINQSAIYGTLRVTKGASGGWAGVASSFSKFSTTTNSYIGLKFLPNGYFQIKYGSGGSYTNAGNWYSPVDSTNARGALYWMIVNHTGAALTAGTDGVLGGGVWTAWQHMDIAREYILSDGSSGTHTCNLEVAIATSSGGASAVIATGTLEVIVP